MNRKTRVVRLLFVGLLLSLVMVACQQDADPVEVEVTRIQEVEVEVEVPGPEVEVTRIVEVEVEVEKEVIVEVPAEVAVSTVPFEELWVNSGHNDKTAEAFIHWDEEDPAEVPTSCARCHSTPGHLDYIGADGSEPWVVDQPAAIGTTVECAACHNDVTLEMTSVTFPSGAEITGLGREARCMQCHQGRHSTVSVNASIEEAGVTDDVDKVSEDLGFSNIHYYAAGATRYGTLAMGGYEYDGRAYDGKFDHVPGYDACIDCHDSHSLEVKIDECSECHEGVESVDDLVDVRMAGSLVDYDGDGDMDEGVYYEIEGLREILYAVMQSYANEITETPFIYDSHAYPYFFIDTDGNGEADEGEANYGNRYNAWTARLAKAAYNYQVSLKDPGRFAHGGKYIIQLLYDSIEDINSANPNLDVDIDVQHTWAGDLEFNRREMQRIDHGHFAGSETAFRRWDDDGEVRSPCSKCHTADGLPLFLEEGVVIAQPVSGGLNCTTCHSSLGDEYARREAGPVTFPSGATVDSGDADANLCLNCHQGRTSTTSMNAAIGDTPPDTLGDGLRFQNIHYFAAGATLFGGDVQGAYEYDGQAYVGRNEHVGSFNVCTECHDTHTQGVRVSECADCHDTYEIETKADLAQIRDGENTNDYDGDGDAEEGIAGEIETMQEMLYVAIQEYAAATEGVDAIIYNGHRYPYFFADVNGDGAYDADDARYSTWTPRLLRAAYNYQYVAKDPGAYTHNGMYVIQFLYDGLADLGADVSGMVRPEVPAE